ncbi:hypothetical protein GCM10020000_82630 [Streptomyces olivoverticillatus]
MEHLDEFGVLTAVSVKVGAHTEHHPDPAGLGPGGLDQRADEPGPFLGVPAHGEDFLELVHHPEHIDPVGLVGDGLPQVEVQVGRIGGQFRPQRPGRSAGQGG